MVGRIDMVEWLSGYGKFLFYSMIDGEHLGTKQIIMCFALH